MKQNDSSKMNKKFITLIFLALALLIFQSSKAYSAETPIFNGSDFDLLFNDGESLITGSSSEYFVNFTVSSGVLNGSDCTFFLYEKSGKITFIPEDNATISFIVMNWTGGIDFQTANAPSQKLAAYNYSVSITQTTARVSLSWRFGVKTFTNWEFYFGMTGVIIMICAPCWFAIKLRSGLAKADEIVERLIYALILFVIGYAMLLIWLGAFA